MNTNIMLKRGLESLTSTAATTRFSSCLSLRLFRSDAAAAAVNAPASSVLNTVNPHTPIYAGVIPIGGRVRLANLPKKRNIDRDLKSAMQGVPGIINIVPAVTGNKKTRDPICKGFAFVDFKRKKDAVRCVELCAGQTITFGKIQKQIKCEVVNAQSSSSSLQLSKNPGALPLPSEQGTKVRQENAPKKKLISKKKVKKVLEIPGSAKRLKIEKKSILTRIFSKYGSRPVVASKDN
ncbi:uncharacterized protein LOC130739957 [Lotus japonicus]|uniref:RRM domain-containing protein n=1 Tax=Lotus japonicus TaxID=34305 RepID=I3SWE0_LOTJA|nr:uncharacterized protein LOC130739957 [Lotus japonicus]AFK44582.1 unknown [Lotus japonicus]